ncbi:thioredoxin-like protein [Xylariomycetidae sp. FL0641]|nr:thioredoxin-like protein [Xylariomycetidae sp. FL0641]
MAVVSPPKLKLYTNHGCPWAHRVHIALAELQLPFDEELIDLSQPRTPQYLQINPRGLVPSLVLADDDTILTESGIVATYLADAHPGRLAPASSEPGGALRRARIAFFVDTYMSKCNGFLLRLTAAADSESEQAELVEEFARVLEKEVEPQLQSAAPFFGGSETLTLAEVLTGPFIVRLWTAPRQGLLPAQFVQGLSERVPNFCRWAEEVAKHPSVTAIFDEKAVALRSKQRAAAMKAARKV